MEITTPRALPPEVDHEEEKERTEGQAQRVPQPSTKSPQEFYSEVVQRSDILEILEELAKR